MADIPGEMPPPVPGPGAASGLPPNLAAALACLVPVVGGIVFLVIEKRNQFVRFYAMQALIFGIAIIVLSIVVKVLIRIPILGILFDLAYALLSLIFLAVWLITLIQALSGKEWEIPYIGPYARKQLASFPAT